MKVNKSISFEMEDLGEIEKLVKSGQYRNVSEFIQKAAEEKLGKEQIITN